MRRSGSFALALPLMRKPRTISGMYVRRADGDRREVTPAAFGQLGDGTRFAVALFLQRWRADASGCRRLRRWIPQTG